MTTKQQIRTDRDGRDPSGFARGEYKTDGYRAGLLKRLRIRLPQRGLLSQRRR